MMGKTFSSEDEQLRSLLDESQEIYPLLKSDDPVIFYNADYERELLMSYDLDFGESCSAQSCQDTAYSDVKPEPTWTSPSESEFNKSPKYTHPTRYNPYSSGPLVKMPAQKASRRGRPEKVTSTSKMANYARNYREMKKNEHAAAIMRQQELEEELRLAREENRRMKRALTDANEEIAQLRKVIDQDSQIANVVARMSDRSMSNICSGSKDGTGVCVHVGSQGATVEVCKQCANSSQNRLQMRTKLDDINPTLELFNGDFASIEHLLNV